MMELYCFGFNGLGQLLGELRSSVVRPVSVKQRESIEVLWTSWCDALIRFQQSHNPDTRTIFYNSPGLDKDQASELLSGITAIALHDEPRCFGSPLHDGLKGIFCQGKYPRIAFIASDSEIEAGEPRVTRFSASFNHGDYRLQHISMTSSGKVYAAIDIGDAIGSTSDELDEHFDRKQSAICEFGSLEKLKSWISSHQQDIPPTLMTLPKEQTWKQLLSNATTTTGLTSDGKVYTWTADPRYPQCLGRSSDEDPPSVPAIIPYLSETYITKIVSGGYMTAALSSDGELFLWGQACPGTDRELEILSSNTTERHDENLFVPDPDDDPHLPQPPEGYDATSKLVMQKWAHEVAIQRLDGTLEPHPEDPKLLFMPLEDEDDQDEFIKRVQLSLGGYRTSIADVAIGSGHVLVAAEGIVGGIHGQLRRIVCGAGRCESGQLGIGAMPRFLRDWTNIPQLKDKRIVSLHAAGWSSWVVVHTESEDDESKAVEMDRLMAKLLASA